MLVYRQSGADPDYIEKITISLIGVRNMVCSRSMKRLEGGVKGTKRMQSSPIAAVITFIFLSLSGLACGAATEPTSTPTTSPATDKAPAPAPATESAGRWQKKAPMPTSRSEIAGAAFGGKLYIAGGLVEDGLTPALEEYDPAADT